MNERIQRQIEHELGDEFKQDVIFPSVANEIGDALCSTRRTLHIGVGSGQIATCLEGLGVKESVLVDLNEEILPYAEGNFAQVNISTVSFAASATQLLPIKPESIDVAEAVFSLNQIESPEVVFDLVNYYLRPNGRFIVIVPDEAYLAGPANHKNGKLANVIKGVLDRTQTYFSFGRSDTQVTLFPRPNTDYSNWFGVSGFDFVEQIRLVDPNDTKLVDTPKAVMMVSRKMPVRFSLEENGGEVRIQNEIVYGNLVAVEVHKEFSCAKLIIDCLDSEVIEIPFPRSESLIPLIDMAMSGKNEKLLIRTIEMHVSNGDLRTIFRIFSETKRLGYYGIKTNER